MTSTRPWALLLALILISGLTQAQARIEEAPARSGQEKRAESTQEAQELQTWVSLLVGRLDARNKVVRTSVRRALVAVGRPALAALQGVAAGKNEARAKLARNLIRQIQNPRRGQGRQGRGQGRGQGRQGARRGGNPLAGLTLTDDQKTRADQARKANSQKTRRLFEKLRAGEMDRAESRAAMRTLREELDKTLQGILTPEQFKKYKANGQHRRSRRRRGADG